MSTSALDSNSWSITVLRPVVFCVLSDKTSYISDIVTYTLRIDSLKSLSKTEILKIGNC